MMAIPFLLFLRATAQLSEENDSILVGVPSVMVAMNCFRLYHSMVSYYYCLSVSWPELILTVYFTARKSSSISSFFLHYGPSSILEEGLWEWVLRFDELSRSMREKMVFWGFQENPISFPPSYRWNRARPTPIPVIDDDVETAVAAAPIVPNYYEGGLAGDFTDIEKLEQAYTTSVTDPPALFGPVVSSLARSLSSFRRSDSGSANKATPPSSPSRGASPRTPSYTDRILTHSLPGKAAYLRWGYYESCDLVELSDHRPVVATLSIKVASDVRGFSIMPPSDGPSTTASTAGGGGSKGKCLRLLLDQIDRDLTIATSLPPL